MHLIEFEQFSISMNAYVTIGFLQDSNNVQLSILAIRSGVISSFIHWQALSIRCLLIPSPYFFRYLRRCCIFFIDFYMFTCGSKSLPTWSSYNFKCIRTNLQSLRNEGKIFVHGYKFKTQSHTHAHTPYCNYYGNKFSCISLYQPIKLLI